MDLKLSIPDNLDKEELGNILKYLNILQESHKVTVDRKNVRCLEDELLTFELGKGELGLSDEYILDLDNVKKIVTNNDGFDISKLKENLSGDYKFLSIKNLSKIDYSFFEEYPEYFDWYKISSLNISEDFIQRNFNRMNKYVISVRTLSTEFIIKNINELIVDILYMTNDLKPVLQEIFTNLNLVDYIDFITKIQNCKYPNDLLDVYLGDIRELKLTELIDE